MKARYFTYGDIPKAVYYLTDIKAELYSQETPEQFYEELKTKWLTNPNVVLVDDRDTSYSSGEIEISQIEKYLSKLEDLKKELDLDDE
jgi:hypothetical protein